MRFPLTVGTLLVNSLRGMTRRGGRIRRAAGAVGASVLALLLSPGFIHAGCAPPDFQKVDFRNLHDLTKYGFLSSVNEEDFKNLSRSFNSGMTIPYIDVPATGDFAQTDQQLKQVQRLTQLHLEQNHRETLLNIGWSELGLQAYKDCLNAQKGEAVIVEPLQGTDPFGSKLAVSDTWQRRTRPDSTPVRDIICLGCTASNLQKSDPIKVGETQLLVLRESPGKACR